jgi:hypothetical protein
MDDKITALERAFQLARSGRLSRIEDIIASLDRDGYSVSQIQGPVLRRQLRALIEAARQPPLAPVDFNTRKLDSAEGCVSPNKIKQRL